MKRFYIVALTGRSGSGKSYASDYLATLGVPVVDGDALSREVTGKESRCLDELVRVFSPGILTEDGALDRRKLGDICFADPAQKRRLDAITHPYIMERLLQYFEAFEARGDRYCLVEAAALIESGLYAICDKIVLITADEPLQAERIMRRDNLTEHQAKRRLEAQMRVDEVRDLCDMIITNNGTLAEFKTKLKQLAQNLEDWFKDESE